MGVLSPLSGEGGGKCKRRGEELDTGASARRGDVAGKGQEIVVNLFFI